MPNVFVSYAEKDKPKVVKLVEALKKEKDIKVWFDEDRILAGEDFLEKMKDGIAAADKVIICLSPSFTSKPPTSWVKQELKMAILKEHKDQQLRIIPVRLKKGGEIPEELGMRAYADLSTKKRWEKNFPKLLEAIRAAS